MKKTLITLLTLIFMAQLLDAQDSVKEAPHIYNPNSDAKADIANAVKLAGEQDKNVLLMIGGNWCPWCIKLHKLLSTNSDLNSLLLDNYIWVMVNYSKENRNMDLMHSLGNPQRFGFPVWVILNPDGNPIHIQDTSLFEMNEDYVPARIKRTLQNWTYQSTRMSSF